MLFCFNLFVKAEDDKRRTSLCDDDGSGDRSVCVSALQNYALCCNQASLARRFLRLRRFGKVLNYLEVSSLVLTFAQKFEGMDNLARVKKFALRKGYTDAAFIGKLDSAEYYVLASKIRWRFSLPHYCVISGTRIREITDVEETFAVNRALNRLHSSHNTR